ncbi:MAG TPA: DUF4124 domain-containing protein [Woeseiaceae bacterium]|nr:DUF4124 domain-containing protein [Woeseiaceae bacterium]
MKRNDHSRALRRAALGLFAAVLGAGTAHASDIYRYTDTEGNVHYVDRPTGAPSEERVAISSKPTNPAQVQARAQTRYGRDAADEAAGEEADKPTRAERAAAAKERADKCQQYRDQLETYVMSRRLYREAPNGEREYLDDSEVAEARSKAEEMVVEHCD